jgi:hypothetical protein
VVKTQSIVPIFLLACAQECSAAWTTVKHQDTALPPIAYTENIIGQRTEVSMGQNNAIELRLLLGAGFETFAASSCPTFQIDDRVPLHHFEIGIRCVIEKKIATFHLGQITDDEIDSLVLHRFMNGNIVMFRYTVNNGRYRRAEFSLRNSNQALKQAIGADTRLLVN